MSVYPKVFVDKLMDPLHGYQGVVEPVLVQGGAGGV